jgi:hypothetical protein
MKNNYFNSQCLSQKRPLGAKDLALYQALYDTLTFLSKSPHLINMQKVKKSLKRLYLERSAAQDGPVTDLYQPAPEVVGALQDLLPRETRGVSNPRNIGMPQLYNQIQSGTSTNQGNSHNSSPHSETSTIRQPQVPIAQQRMYIPPHSQTPNGSSGLGPSPSQPPRNKFADRHREKCPLCSLLSVPVSTNHPSTVSVPTTHTTPIHSSNPSSIVSPVPFTITSISRFLGH